MTARTPDTIVLRQRSLRNDSPRRDSSIAPARPPPLPNCDACLAAPIRIDLAGFRDHGGPRDPDSGDGAVDSGRLRSGDRWSIDARSAGGGEHQERAHLGALALPPAAHQSPGTRVRGRVLFAGLVAFGAWYVQFRMFRTNGLLWSLAACSLSVPIIDWLLPGDRYTWLSPPAAAAAGAPELRWRHPSTPTTAAFDRFQRRTI